MSSAELDEFVAQVRERTDICSVISRYVSLNQRGGKYWGLCPFHNEKTPSFSVDAGKGFFYCFGCHTGGNVFKFLSLIENISYFDAIKLQAERLGIEMPRQKLSPEEERRRREEKILFNANTLAQEFYHECLINTARGEVGRKYFAGRGITPSTIETFKLGFAPDGWDALLTALTRRGLSVEQLEKVGLVKRRTDNSGFYDRFRARVMIPINDVFGRTVAFGGRIIVADENSPKYLNSPETALFNKRNLLFGLDKAHLPISSAGFAIVVEGYMDAISLVEAGIKNVVATLGTAFTPEHAKLLLRYARKIIFCYDSDEAGQRATMRALPIVQATGADVFIVKVPEGKDPDDFIRKHGKAAFDALVKNAEPLVDYRLNYVLATVDYSTVQGKYQALQEILPVVEKVTDPVTRSEYRKKISAALVLEEGVIDEEWRKFLRNHEPPLKIAPKNFYVQIDPLIRATGETILRMVWNECDLASYVTSTVPLEVFAPVHLEILNWLKACSDAGRRPDDLSAANDLSPQAFEELSRILLNRVGEPDKEDTDAFDDAIKALRRTVLKKKYSAFLARAEEYINAGNPAYIEELQESVKVKNELDNL